jgi:uncharacterized protein YxjI
LQVIGLWATTYHTDLSLCLGSGYSTPLLCHSTLWIWKGEDESEETWLIVKGSFLKKKIDVIETATGSKVMTVTRKRMKLTDILLVKDSYYLTVNPGFDCALAVILALAIDEQFGTLNIISRRLSVSL